MMRKYGQISRPTVELGYIQTTKATTSILPRRRSNDHSTYYQVHVVGPLRRHVCIELLDITSRHMTEDILFQFILNDVQCRTLLCCHGITDVVPFLTDNVIVSNLANSIVN